MAGLGAGQNANERRPEGHRSFVERCGQPQRYVLLGESVADLGEEIDFAWALFFWLWWVRLVVHAHQDEDDEAQDDEAEQDGDPRANFDGWFTHDDGAVLECHFLGSTKADLDVAEVGLAEDASNDWHDDVIDQTLYDWRKRQCQDQSDGGFENATFVDEVFEFLNHGNPPQIREPIHIGLLIAVVQSCATKRL